jgi:hypothetical protein
MTDTQNEQAQGTDKAVVSNAALPELAESALQAFADLSRVIELCSSSFAMRWLRNFSMRRATGLIEGMQLLQRRR